WWPRLRCGLSPAGRVRRPPARRPRDELRPAGLRGPLPPDARPAGLLPDGVRRQRPADRAVRGTDPRRAGGGPATVAVRRAVPGRDPPGGRRVRGAVAPDGPVRRLVAALLHDRAPLAAGRPGRVHPAVPRGTRAPGPE